MKVILSRKGFDSTYGGYPSPILPGGKLVSLPISSSDTTKYCELKVNGKLTYFTLMKQLNIRYLRIKNNRFELTKNTTCHLDPDIIASITERDKNWKPCFGQINQAQAHLSNQGVKENDLFLFFGWFKETVRNNDIFQFKNSAADMHVIFGYLQIGKILQVNNSTVIPKWLQKHPHASCPERKKNLTNTIYIARDSLTWNKAKPGAGLFKFNDNLVLTKKGFSRSKWELPSFFRKVKISRHTEESWKEEEYFKSVDIGQEFVIEDNEEVENWAKQLIDNYGY